MYITQKLVDFSLMLFKKLVPNKVFQTETGREDEVKIMVL